MERPQYVRGAVVIPHFGKIAAGRRNFRHPVEQLMKDPACAKPWAWSAGRFAIPTPNGTCRFSRL